MADDKKVSVKDSEVEANIMLNTDEERVLNSKLTREEWDALVAKLGYVGVSHADRKAWLKANGYEITRENMRDPNLSSKQ